MGTTGTKRSTTRRTRQAAAAKPKLMVVAGYLRLSVDRNGDKIGYDVQQAAIEQWALAMGYTVRWFKDPDVTAGKKGVVRPEYELMLKAIAAGEVAGIVVWRLDRLVRLTHEFERCFGIVEDAGAFIFDVDQSFSTKSDIGKFIMRLLVMLAEMEIAAMRARARGHQQMKAENGKLSGGGHRPFGFVGAKHDKTTRKVLNAGEALIAHDPTEAALIREAAKLIVKEGAIYSDIVREWDRRGIVGTNGHPIGVGALQQILTRPRIAGLREYEIVNEDTGEITMAFSKAVWEPILDRATWEELCSLVKRQGPRVKASSYLLGDGLLRCHCGQAMIGGATRSERTDAQIRNYRCNASLAARKTGACGGLMIRADELEDTVLELLFARLDETPELIDLIEAKDNLIDKSALSEALAEVRLCNDELSKLGWRVALPAHDPQGLDEIEAQAMRAGYRSRKAEAETVIGATRKATHVPRPTGDEVDDLRGWFGGLLPGQRQNFLRAHVTELVVGPRTRGGHVFDPRRLTKIRFTRAQRADGKGQ